LQGRVLQIAEGLGVADYESLALHQLGPKALKELCVLEGLRCFGDITPNCPQ